MCKIAKYAVYFFVLLIMLQGCLFMSDDAKEVKQFFESTRPDERKLRMETYTLEDQYKIFLYGRQRVHPPLNELAEPIARRGREAIPFLLSRLEATKNDLDVLDIVYIFKKMVFLRTYDVKNDPAVITALNNRVSNMSSSAWKQMSLRNLEIIQTR
jgi:hypothetical protein